jgi:threonine/homoserine/homoserine lactone efflux protein
MKLRNFIKRLFTNTCVYFTLVSIAMILLGLLDKSSASGIGFNTSALLFIPFGILMALAQEVLCAKKLSRTARFLGHYVITLAAIIALFATKASFTATNLIILLAFLSILYWMIFGIVVLIRKRVKRIFSED